ncbi:MAG TPA: hypothetical protein VFY95_01190 [Sphingomicrobium sp.]
MRYDPITTQRSLWAERLPLVSFLSIAPLLFLLPITHDAIWQIWIGREMLHGAALYSDIIEVNPPLWFWMAIPQAAVGQLLGLESRLVVIGFFVACIIVSLLLSPARYRLPLLVAFAILPLSDFGQREHFTLITTAPYVFLIAARSQESRTAHPWIIGFFAAFGLALKPYFIVVPIALELFAWSKPRIRPETAALAISALAYAVGVLLFAPSYLTEIVPMVRQAYGSFQGHTTNALCFIAFGLALIGAVGRKGAPATRALVITAVAFLPAVIIQGKGWPYHTIPARGFLFLAIAIELFRHRGRPAQDGLLVAAAVLCLQPFGVYQNQFRSQMERHLDGVPRGSSIAVLASNPSLAWPMVDEYGLKWTLREAALWRLEASNGNPALTAALKREVAEDLEVRPDVLIIARRQRMGPAAEALLPVGYLVGYRPKLQTRTFRSYVRLSVRAGGTRQQDERVLD